MQTISTNEYPTRYAAFENPNIIIEQTDIKNRNGYELAVYNNPIKNIEFPHLFDGVYAEICYHFGKYYLDVHACKPSYYREQNGHGNDYDSYQEAYTAMLDKIEYFNKWVLEPGKDKPEPYKPKFKLFDQVETNQKFRDYRTRYSKDTKKHLSKYEKGTVIEVKIIYGSFNVPKFSLITLDSGFVYSESCFSKVV